MDSVKSAKRIEKEVINMRRFLHEYPESSMNEINTMHYVEDKLKEYGIETEYVKDGGIIGTLRGKRGGKTIVLRSDLDALAMKEDAYNLKKKKTIVSRTEKSAHTCGHDAHMAMLLGAAKILASHKNDLKGKILFAFEQGEEISGGIQKLLKRLVDIGADGVWGIHLKNDLEAGKISVEAGPRMSAVYPFHVEITGASGHGSRPDLSVSPVDVFHDFYSRLQVSRLNQLNPFEPITFSVGNVQAGQEGVGNVIPEKLQFHGTARFLDMKQGEDFTAHFTKILNDVTAAHDAAWRFLKKDPMDLPVYNNIDCSHLAARSIQNSLGSKTLASHPAWMASDPFAFYQRYFPGIYSFLGIKNDKKGIGSDHHSAKFDVDEDVLYIGVAATVQYAIDFLSSKQKIQFKREKRSVDKLFADIFV